MKAQRLTTLALLWQNGASPFVQFLRFSDWLHCTLRRTHLIALHVIAQSLFDFLVKENGVEPTLAASTLEGDWHRTPSREALSLRLVAASLRESCGRRRNSFGALHNRRCSRGRKPPVSSRDLAM